MSRPATRHPVQWLSHRRERRGRGLRVAAAAAGAPAHAAAVERSPHATRRPLLVVADAPPHSRGDISLAGVRTLTSSSSNCSWRVRRALDVRSLGQWPVSPLSVRGRPTLGDLPSAARRDRRHAVRRERRRRARRHDAALTSSGWRSLKDAASDGPSIRHDGARTASSWSPPVAGTTERDDPGAGA
jgi:hypothetical protein